MLKVVRELLCALHQDFDTVCKSLELNRFVLVMVKYKLLVLKYFVVVPKAMVVATYQEVNIVFSGPNLARFVVVEG